MWCVVEAATAARCNTGLILCMGESGVASSRPEFGVVVADGSAESALDDMGLINIIWFGVDRLLLALF